jgi:hypothetical protein
MYRFHKWDLLENSDACMYRFHKWDLLEKKRETDVEAINFPTYETKRPANIRKTSKYLFHLIVLTQLKTT